MRMDEVTINEREVKVEPWNPKQINPALMTLAEYTKLCNEGDKWHPSSAYDTDVEGLNRYGNVKSDYKPVRRFRANGLDFELMLRTEHNQFAARNPNPDANGSYEPYLRVNGQILYYTDEERDRLGLQPESYTIAIFHEDKRVATAQDEWGAMLVQVAEEYRAFGLGTILGKFARTLEPAKPSGGFTNAGFRNFVRVHREFVRDALASGLYTNLVRQGTLTMERVRVIVESAHINMRNQKQNIDLSSSKPDSWLLYADLHGSFILYDRKLLDVMDSDVHEAHIDRMVKGYVYAMAHESAGITRIKQFGADTKQLQSFMLSLAYTVSKVHELPLWVEPEEYGLKGFEYGPENNVVGYSSREVLSGHMVDYRAMVDEERRFRKRFDQYDEFLHRLQELAHSKFRG